MGCLVERLNDRFPCNSLGFSERQCKRKTHVLVNVRDRDSGKFTSGIQRETCKRVRLEDESFLSRCVFIFESESMLVSLDHARRHAVGGITRSYGKQKTMLIDNVERMDVAQESATSSLKRLECLNGFDRL